MNINNPLILKELENVLVYDIETGTVKEDLSIRGNYEEYVQHASVKWFGAYSYRTKEYYLLNVVDDYDEIINLINSHKTFVGFNNKSFDSVVLKNDGFTNWYGKKQLDLHVILGNNAVHGHKLRSNYMPYKLKKVVVNGKEYGENSLMSMGLAFGLSVSKDDIDYKVFNKNFWSDEEKKSIKHYLQLDVQVTKELFEKTVEYWELFCDWLQDDEVTDWKFIDSTIASMTYMAACKIKKVTPTYGQRGEDDEMGGRAVPPSAEESYGVHYVDEKSKYPHIFSMFGLCSEVDVSNWAPKLLDLAISKGYVFHGNDMFKCRGYYNVKEQGVLEKDILVKLKTRFLIKDIIKDYYKNNVRQLQKIPNELKEVIGNDGLLTDDVLNTLKGLEYAIKIFANSLYGAVRSSVFEKISTPNAGYDCCWLGQQIHKFVQEFFEERGYKVVGGFTDSWFVQSKPGESKDDFVKLCDEVVSIILKNVPFPADTYGIGYECLMSYLLYNYDDKRQEFKKNNYCYITEGKVKIVGFPIMKSNATRLSMKVFKEHLEPLGLQNNRLKFDKFFVKKLLYDEIDKDLSLVSVLVKCNPASSYKTPGQLQAQVSNVYFEGREGEIRLIKNSKIGRVGKGSKYCTVEEFVEFGGDFEDLVLDKVWNELSPFLLPEKVVSLSDWGL